MELATVQQAARILGVTPGRVYTLLWRGKLQGYRHPQYRGLVIKVADLERRKEWLASYAVAAGQYPGSQGDHLPRTNQVAPGNEPQAEDRDYVGAGAKDSQARSAESAV